MNHRAVARMKDIADDLGISSTTVFRALRNLPDIARETKTRILERAIEMNYRPNLSARALVTGHSSLIGLIVPDLVHPFYSDVAKTMSTVLRRHHYFVIISSSENDPQLESDEIDQILAHHPDCVVVASCQRNADSLRQITDSGVPLILLNRRFKKFDCNFVGVDDYRASELAMEHLVAQGYRHIAYILGPRADIGESRVRGYLNAIRKNNLSIMEECVIFAHESSDLNAENLGRRAMDRILNLNPRPDAVLCHDDAIAIGAVDRAFEAGLRIPEDIAFLGCGNFHYSSRLRVPLSSIDQKSSEVGERAARLVHSILTRPSSRSRTVILEPELVVRASSFLR